MKTFLKIIVVMLVVLGFAKLMLANDLDTIRVNSWYGGTNINAVSSNSTSSAQIAPPITNGSQRIACEINNTNNAQGVGIKFFSNYGTTTPPDVIVGPNQDVEFYFGEGWNTQISARSTNATAGVNFIYNEQYR